MKNLKALWITVAFVCATLALIALAGQAVTARPASQELKPPFNFVQTAQPAQADHTVVLPGSTVLMTETFGAAFTATTSLVGTTPQWRVAVNEGDIAGYYWGRVGVSGTITFTNSVWNAGRPVNPTQVLTLTPGISTYPTGQDTWLLYGPIDLSRYSYAHLSFEAYLDSEAGDTLMWAMSPDGQNFYGSAQSGPLGGWITNTYSFRANSSYQAVYLAFAFNSHANPQGLGAFIRNVRLTGEPLKFTYLGYIMKDYAAPTPTPVPPLYGYTFDPGNTTNLAQWGGVYNNSGTTKYGQCIPGQIPEQCPHYTSAHGNPADSLRLYTNGLYSFVASSPNDIVPNDYDLYVDISPWVIYPRDASCVLYGCPTDDLGDWYGIIFNASSDTFGTNPSQFAYNKTYYRVYFYNVDATKPIAIRLDRCDGSSNSGNNSCHKLGSSSLPSNFIGGAGGFDTVHIQRLADGSIQIWLNGTLLITATDATYTGSSYGKYGVFIFSWDNNATQYPAGYEMQVDFDNIKVYQR
jgi:hypothetical protein